PLKGSSTDYEKEFPPPQSPNIRMQNMIMRLPVWRQTGFSRPEAGIAMTLLLARHPSQEKFYEFFLHPSLFLFTIHYSLFYVESS
ncbi:MAG: hypothetical protein V3S48_00315, partial [Candidatus Neomarinimicrobiota bacterium]